MEAVFETLGGVGGINAQGEYYLTDIVAAYRRHGRGVGTFTIESADELRGVNSRVDLADLGAVMRDRKNREIMLEGVTLEGPATTSIDQHATIGGDTPLGPGARLH